MRWRALISLAAVCTMAIASGRAQAAPAPVTLPGFAEFGSGTHGGTLWQGVIPNRFVPDARRVSIVYLPPGYTRTDRYPVLYVLHGLPGSPYSISQGLDFADVADGLIASGRVPAFIAVMPVAGVTERFKGEWTGPWESFLVHGVIPWADTHLGTVAAPDERAIAGLSAGAYGATDIALRHPTLFSTVESWSGYFRPYRDGSLAHATPSVLAAHNPSDLARSRAAELRREGVRFFLSAGSTHDRKTAAMTRSFSRELTRLRIGDRLELLPGGHDGRFWRRQLPAALTYALAGRNVVAS